MESLKIGTTRLLFLAIIISVTSFAGNMHIAMANQGGFINPGNKPAPPGSLPGIIDVSGSGAATYNIPLELPEGIGGTMPTIAITYNSQAGNGLLGYGWNLAGISAITRVPKTVFYDGEAGHIGFDSNDRYALDGQRLLVVSGTYGGNNSKYSTENYTFDDIRSLGGTINNPNSFRITTTDGTILEYSHRIIAPGTTSSVYMWLLSKVTDRRGNFMEYVYASATGGQVQLSQIKYTGNQNSNTKPLHTISFSYIDKTSKYKDHYYVGGRKFDNNLQLTQIEISNGRKYTFTVINNKLQEISLYQNDILLVHPTTIQWGNENNHPFFEYVDPTGEYLDLENKNAIVGDFTGDGKNEVLVIEAVIDAREWKLYKMLDNNKFSLYANGSFPLNNREGGESHEHCGYYNDTDYSGSKTPGSEYKCYTFTVNKRLFLPYTIVDINGDGVLNMCFVEKDTDGKFSFKAYDIENGTLTPKQDYQFYDIEVDGGVSRQDAIVTGDFNGDGKMNVLIGRKNFQGSVELDLDDYTKVHFVNLNNFGHDIISLYAANFRNSPNSQLIAYDGHELRVFNANKNAQGKYTFQTIANTPYITKHSQFAYPGDYNGDGLIDVLIYNESLEKWQLFISNGLAQFILQPDNQVPIQGSPAELYYEIPYDFQNNMGMSAIHKNFYIPVDFNGDGKTDILRFQREISVRVIIDGYPSEPFIDPPSIGFLPSNDGLHDFIAKYSLYSYTSNGIGFLYESGSMINGASFSYPLECSPFEPPTLIGLGDGVFGSMEFKKPSLFLYFSGYFPILSGILHENGIPTIILTSKNHDQGNPKEGFLQMHNDVHKNLVVSITNGNGVITEIDYGWLNDPAIYTLESTPDSDPITERHLPIRVVSGIKTSMLASPYSNTTLSDITYKYNTVRFHRDRGFLGFKQTEIYDDISKIRTILEFDIDTEFYIPYLKKSTTRKGSINLGSVEYENNYISKGTGFFMQSQGKTTNRDLLTGLTTYNRFAINPNTGQLIVKVDSAGTDGYIKAEYFYNGSLPDPTLIRTTRTQGGGTFVEQTAFEYYSDRNLKKTIDNNGNHTTFTYQTDKTNLKTAHNATTGITEELFYDNTRRFVTKTETKKAGLETLTEFATYDDFGRPLTTTCINGRVTTYTYDVYGQLTQITNPDNSTTTFSYGWENNWSWYTKAVTSLGDESWVYYDLAGRERSQKSRPAGNSTMVTITSVYNTDGSLKETISTLDGKTTYNYQTTGRISSITAKGRTVNYTYSGNQITTNVNGVVSRERFNAFGQLTEAIDPGGTITYEYHASGQPSTINYNGTITSITYDNKGRQISLNDPNAGLSTFTYDNLNRLVTQQDANGVTTTMTYDDYGRPLTKTQAGRVVSYTYDPPSNKGALHTMEDMQSGVKITYSYDHLGRMISQTERIDGIDYSFSYTYDTHGRVSTMTYPSGFSINNTYSGNYLTRIRDHSNNQDIITNILYTARSQVRQYSTFNGPRFFQTFDSHGYPKTTEIGTSSTNHSRKVILDYDFNPATLNLMSRIKRTHNGSTTVASETFTYDPLDRLTGWDVTVGVQTQNYHLNYANNGNITQKSDMGVYQYQAEKPNAVTNVSNLSGSRFNSLENNIQYTPFNKVSTLDLIRGGTMIGYYNITYGPDDQRRKSNFYDYITNTDITTLYIGLYEERSTGEQLHYIPTPAGIGAVMVTYSNNPGIKDFYYLYHDHLGSLIAATQRGSTVLEEFSYDPWGRRRDAHNWNNYEVAEPTLFTRGFTGHEHIGAYGLINMNGRVYDPRLGRFMSPDPYVQAPDFSQSFNRYSYVWNNPLKYTDPSGEFVHLIIGAIIGGYSGYKIGKAKGATGWGMFWHIAGGAAIGTVAGHVGASVFASGMAAGSAAGMGGISAGFNAGLLSGMASGAITGAGMAALGGGSFADVLGGATMGAWFGAVAGGAFGVVPGGIENLKDWKNFWGTKYTSGFIASANPNEIFYAWGRQVTITAKSLVLRSKIYAATGLAAKYILVSASMTSTVLGVASLTSVFYGGARVAKLTGIARAKMMGNTMEKALGMTGPKQAIQVGGRIRVPDRLDLFSRVIGESKNVKHLNYTSQIKDYFAFAQDNGLEFILYTRKSTTFSKPLQSLIDNGLIRHIGVPGF